MVSRLSELLSSIKPAILYIDNPNVANPMITNINLNMRPTLLAIG